MLSIFRVVSEVIAIIVALVTIVERPGDGEQKRADVVRLFLEQAKRMTLPSWAANLFLRESFVGWLVDVVVWAANAFGFFTGTDEPETA